MEYQYLTVAEAGQEIACAEFYEHFSKNPQRSLKALVSVINSISGDASTIMCITSAALRATKLSSD